MMAKREKPCVFWSALFLLVKPPTPKGHFVSLSANSNPIITMIQRMQTVYLLFAVASAVLLFFYPIAEFGDGISSTHYVKLYIFKLIDYVPGNEPLFSTAFLYPLVVLNSLVAIISLASIFMFKKLMAQLKLIRFALFLNIALIAAIFFFYTNQVSKAVLDDPAYQFGIYLPIITLLFIILAMRGVQKDIKLIRSADRLR